MRFVILIILTFSFPVAYALGKTSRSVAQDGSSEFPLRDYTARIVNVNAITEQFNIYDSKKNLICTTLRKPGEMLTDVSLLDFTQDSKRIVLTTWNYDRAMKYIVFDLQKGKDCIAGELQDRALDQPEFDHIHLVLTGTIENADDPSKIDTNKMVCAFENKDQFVCKQLPTTSSSGDSPQEQ